MYRFPWYLTLVSTNHASSNPGLTIMDNLHGKTLIQSSNDRGILSSLTTSLEESGFADDLALFSHRK